MTGCKTKDADIHMVDNASPKGITSAYANLVARPYQQQAQSTQAPKRAFNQRGRPDPPHPLRRESRKYTPLPILMVDLYAYLLKRKLVTSMFARPRKGPPSPGFDSSKGQKAYP